MGDDNHYKILIADDREDNLGLLREWLSAQDYYVRCARDGREALDMARKDPPDLVLLDKVMPEVDGLSVARELKKATRPSPSSSSPAARTPAAPPSSTTPAPTTSS